MNDKQIVSEEVDAVANYTISYESPVPVTYVILEIVERLFVQ